MEFHVGVSGFSYPGWKGKFYPENLRSEEFLSHYATRLGSVEINSSFYAPPKEAMVRSWAGKTAESFKFAFKAPKLVTHILKLGAGSQEAANRFSKTLDILGPRRGPILFQLPPFAKENGRLLQEFLDKTPDISGRVFEFRHESWFNASTYRLLEENRACLCVAETEDMKPILRVIGGIAYFRLRKDSYDAKMVDGWAKKIRETAKAAQDCYVYLRHDETGENALLARRLSELLGA